MFSSVTLCDPMDRSMPGCVGKVMSLLFNMLSRLVIGEGNGNPLQYSCLENPMERGAWGVYSLQGHKELDMTEHGTPRGTLETNTTM